MVQAPLYTQDGKKTGEVELPAFLFDVKVNEQLVHLALQRQLANARVSGAHTLRRGEVSGSTRKLFRQKGTGQARRGDRRSPVLRGGGVAWGPRNSRNFKKDLPKKARRLALASVLTSKARENKILALENWNLEQPKTKIFTAFKKALPEHRTLLVIHNRNENLIKSARNLPRVKTLLVNLLNVHDLTRFDQILFEKSALIEAEKNFKIKAKKEDVPAVKAKKVTKKTAAVSAGVV